MWTRPKTISVVSDSYALWGQTPGEPARQEDPSRWRKETLADEQLTARYGVTVDDLASWRTRFGFPRPTREYVASRLGSYRNDWHRETGVVQVRAWEDQIRELAARLPRK